MQYGVTFEPLCLKVCQRCVKLQQKVARHLQSQFAWRQYQKQEQFSLPLPFFPSRERELTSSLWTNLRQFIFWLYPIAKATGLA